jgi:predicted nucleic acid-binding protein
MKVLFDTNVLLDALLAREPFVADAAFLTLLTWLIVLAHQPK